MISQLKLKHICIVASYITLRNMSYTSKLWEINDLCSNIAEKPIKANVNEDNLPTIIAIML